MPDIYVVKRDGKRELFDANKINLALVKASEGLPEQIAKVVQVASEVQLTLFDGITSEQLDEAVITPLCRMLRTIRTTIRLPQDCFLRLYISKSLEAMSHLMSLRNYTR